MTDAGNNDIGAALAALEYEDSLVQTLDDLNGYSAVTWNLGWAWNDAEELRASTVIHTTFDGGKARANEITHYPASADECSVYMR